MDAGRVFKKLWANGLEEYDELKGIQWRWQSMDGAMTKALWAGKKTGPIRRIEPRTGQTQSACEGRGVPLELASMEPIATTSSWSKRRLLSIPVRRPEVRLYWQQNMCLDKGYDYDEVRDLLRDFRYTAHIRARGEEAREIKRAAGFKASGGSSSALTAG